jgi:hypothetical protein
MQAQCNVFEGASGEIALTAAGGLRQITGLTETFENAALVTSYAIPLSIGLISKIYYTDFM